VHADCDDGDEVCTLDTCLNSSCVFSFTGADGCCATEPLKWDFNTLLNFNNLDPQFQLTGSSSDCLWQIYTPTGDQTASIGTDPVLYYGNAAQMNFDCGATQGTALSTPGFLLDENVGLTLSFSIFMSVETSPDTDRLTVEILTPSTTPGEPPHVYQLWDKEKLNQMGQWETHTVDLSAFAGKFIQLQIKFDTVDELNNGEVDPLLGVFLDDVIVSSTCTPTTCSTSADCDDGLDVTIGVCSAGTCSWTFD
jgi:hypothetical protein